jgi:hypothetical protein
MRTENTRASRDGLDCLADELSARLLTLSSEERGNYVGSELSTVDRALSHVQDEGLARGPVFCEWGSGLGGVCAVAALNGFTPTGIEIQPELVASARSLAVLLDLPMAFAEGTFLLPGDEDLAEMSALQTRHDFCARAWNATGLTPGDCDVVFAYPWPGEEAFVDSVFARHASPDALLLTFHDFDRVLAQRKSTSGEALLTHGWL